MCDPFDPPASVEYADLLARCDHPCVTKIIGGQMRVIPLTDFDDLIDYYEAMLEVVE